MAEIKSINSIAVADLKSLNSILAANLGGVGGLDFVSGASEAEKSYAKGQVISSVYDICSDPANIKGLWIFDQHGAATSVTDRSPQGHNATLSANGSTLSPNYAGLCPYVDLTDDAYFEVADHNDFSFGDGSTDSAFSVLALIYPNNISTANYILAKYDTTTGSTEKEYALYAYSDHLEFYLFDDSSGGSIFQNTLSISGDDGGWHSYIATYDGSGNNSGINVYRDGASINNTAGGSSYTAMENKAAKVGNYAISTAGARTNIGDHNFGVIAVIKEELSAAKVKQISQVLLSYANSLS